MNKSTNSQIRLGLFLTLGIALFVVGIYLIGERQQLFRQTFKLVGVFTDVGGLQAGNNVRLSGVNIGSIDNISIISDSLVQVEMVIDEDVRRFIKRDAIASIGAEGLMGNKVVVINPGTGQERAISDNSMINTQQPIELDDILLSLRNTADNAALITQDLARISHNLQSGKGTVGRLLMDQSMARNFDTSMVNLKQGTEKFGVLIDNVNQDVVQNLDSAIANFKLGSNDFQLLMEKAKQSWLLWGFGKKSDDAETPDSSR